MSGYQYNIADELLVDNFAGGGGASTGIELATGRIVNIAVNHDRAAIEMHERNHPYTTHYCEDIWQVDPREATHGLPVALAWFSPDCKHFSKAKGGAPVSKNIRGLAWVAVRWAATVRPRVLFLENVEEFMTWGPLKNGQPIKEQSGRTFHSFVNALKKLGYEVDWRVMTASEYGAPTSRKRFYLVARCDGQPIVFPKPTHGKGAGLLPFRTAAECIDFSLRDTSIFNRRRPLSLNTLKRIARGLDKFVIKSPSPYIISNNTRNAPHGIDEPLPTITTGNRNYLLAPTLAGISQTGGGDRVQSVEKPLRTICAKNEHIVSSAYLTKYFGGDTQAGASVDKPMPTVTAIDHNALVSVFLSSRHGDGSDGRGKSVNEPLPTVTATDHNELVSPYLVKYYSGEEQAQSVDAPLHTITVEPRFYEAAAHICTLRHNMDGQSAREPLSTITAKASHHAAVKSYLAKYRGGGSAFGNWEQVRELLNKYAGYNIKDDEILIFDINGDEFFIYDIGMRMLEPFELAAAQGFPPDYVLKVSASYSKKAQIARIGNSVCPIMAEVLVRANLPEICKKKKLNTMSELNRTLTA